MSNLFNEESDSESEIKVDNEYAKNYNTWRKKEELNKLKTKYGEIDESGDESSSSSEDDDECVDLTDKMEQDFFKTLANLKNKDPKIYDEKVKFFDDAPIDDGTKKKKTKNGPMYINDYERKLLLENDGLPEDENEEENSRANSPTYVQEQEEIKRKLKSALTRVEEDDDEGWGGLFQSRQKTKEDKEKEEVDYKQWLLGQKQNLDDEDVATELRPLKDYWNDPKLDDGEKFLRDYVLKKKFLENDDASYVPTYDEIVHDSDQGLSEDEDALQKQEEFEHKYNYRFEEPDQDFIKRYPRTMEHSLRKKDDKRKVKRVETKERKQKEKQQKMDDLKQLRDLKRQEIEEKLKKLREITGNTEVGFEGQDLDDDFDPEAHDKRMRALFSEEFYEGEEGDQKPEFPELDEELEIERWDKYTRGSEANEDNTPHCEDDNFNMDCDYDPASAKDEIMENSIGRKKRKRKSKFAAAISEPKPTFDPEDKTYEEYLDEYYKLDCEDIIGDIPCRFKYRKVIPNNFGLTMEEILKANDRELNRWCSIKKATQHRPEHVEKYDQIAFSKKAQNESLKRKILPSLYANETDVKEASTSGNTQQKKRKGNRNNENAAVGNPEALSVSTVTTESKDEEANSVTATSPKQKKQKKNRNPNVATSEDSSQNCASLVVNKTVDAKTGENMENRSEESVVANKSEGKKSKKKKLVNFVDEKNSENVNNGIEKNVINNNSEVKKNKKKKVVNKKTFVDVKNTENMVNRIEKNVVNKNSEVKKSRKRKLSNKKANVENESDKKKLTNNETEMEVNVAKAKKKKSKKRKIIETQQTTKKIKTSNVTELSDARLQAFGIKPKKFKNKIKYGKTKNSV